jgi:solute carrier family 35 (UDP-xylose/UDP-N-acetylglucosamine transporter), member B4
MTSVASSLAVTMAITLRKFVSLVVSIFYFQNPFSKQHTIGTLAVVVGSFLFIDAHKYLVGSGSSKQKTQ